MAFLPTLPSGNVYTYLTGSAFLANLIPPNKHSFKEKSKFKSLDHLSNS